MHSHDVNKTTGGPSGPRTTVEGSATVLWGPNLEFDWKPVAD
jgi:hypothetical protein